MLLGLILFVVGLVLLSRNRSFASLWEGDHGVHGFSFNHSVARQNIVGIGALCIVAGLVMAVFL